MRREGIDLDRAVAGTSLLPSHADAPPARVSWDEHALLTDRFADAVGGVKALEDLFEREQREAMPLLSLIAGSVLDPVDLYRLMDQVLAPSLYPMFEIHVHVRPDGAIDAAGHLPARFRPSLAFMHAMVGLHRGAPRMLGLPSAVVEAVTTGHSVQMRITPPHPGTRLLGRVAHLGREVLDEVAVLSRELTTAFAELRTSASEAVLAKGHAETERAQREQSELRLDGVLRSVGNAVFVCDAAGVRALNDAAREALAADAALLDTVRALARAPTTRAPHEGRLTVQRMNDGTTLVVRMDDALADRLAERSAAWGLTPRQRDVLAGVAEALSNKELCERLGCSLPTVETHISAVLRKSGAMSRQELLVALWSGGRGTRKV